MDFCAPTEVVNQLVEASKHGIYGYTNIYESYYQAVQEWMKKSYDWEVPREWIVFCPRIIQAVSLIIQNFTEKGDGILIQTPLYSPLKNAIELNDRRVVNNPLMYKDGGYKIDFKDLESKFTSGVKAMILCSPHNPVGRVWDVEELMTLAKLCNRYNVMLISDEVHADFTFSKSHIPVAKIPDFLENVIVCTSPAKTFNLPGLEVSNIIIPNQVLREKFQLNLKQAGIHNPTYFAVPALEQAYSHGENWLLKVKEYIKGNYKYVSGFLAENLPELQVIQSEGTYLMWIDCRNSGFNESDLINWIFVNAKVSVSLGSAFGREGEGFIRLNLATPKGQLEEALDRICKSYPVK